MIKHYHHDGDPHYDHSQLPYLWLVVMTMMMMMMMMMMIIIIIM